MSNTTCVTVVGSYNAGALLKGGRLPTPGETVIAEYFSEIPGGKGSNTAVAASTLGAEVQFIARIGNDRYAEEALAMYRAKGISTKYILRDATTHTGFAAVLVDDRGRNLISVAPGANYRLSSEDLDAAEEAFACSLIVAFQLENRMEVVDYGIRKAHALGAKTLLDPAPAARLPHDLYPYLDFIKPNEHEASILTGMAVTGIEEARRAGSCLVERGVKVALVTLGELGVVCVSAKGAHHYVPPLVNAIDTTGAGDTFCGAFLAAFSQGQDLAECIRFANCAASISVTRLGVIEAIPRLEEVLARDQRQAAWIPR
jgi:ribokinase